METPNGPAPVPIAKGSSEQLVVVKSPSGTAADHQIACSPTWNVRQLKERLENEYPGSPSARAQRLIHAGKLLDDRQLLSDALRHSTTVHLVVRTPDPDTRRTAGLPRPVQRRPDPAATAESVAAVVAADAPSLSRVPQTAPPAAAAAARPTAPTTPAMAAPRSPMSAGHYSQYTQWGYQAQQPPPGYRFAVINGVTYAVPIRTPETPTTASLVQGAAAATGAGNAEGAEPAEAVAAPVAGAAADVAHNNNNNNNNHGAAMAVAREPRESQWRILVKLVLLVWILSPGASAQRLAIMIIGAFVAFLWQTGRLEWTPSPAGAPVERAGGGEGARRGEEEGGGEGEGSDAEYVTTDDEQGAEEGAAAEAATGVRRRRRRTAEGEREGEGRPVGAAATALAWYVSLIDMLHLFVVSLLPTRPAHA